MAQPIRQFNFAVGPETSSAPTTGTPTNPTDVVTLAYGNENYGVTFTNSYASPTSITAGAGITASDTRGVEVLYVQGSGGAVNITANPQISSPSAAGKRLVLVGTNSTNTLTLDHGDGLVLNGSFVLRDQSQIVLLWDGLLWREMSRVEQYV